MDGVDGRQRWRALYVAHWQALFGYACRRADTVENAADVVSEVFLVAWRRLDEVPTGPQARLWLFGVARLTLQNQQQGQRRRDHVCADWGTLSASKYPFTHRFRGAPDGVLKGWTLACCVPLRRARRRGGMRWRGTGGGRGGLSVTAAECGGIWALLWGGRCWPCFRSPSDGSAGWLH